MTEVEQANTQRISELIDRCESLFAVERQAWVSTAMSNMHLDSFRDVEGDKGKRKSE